VRHARCTGAPLRCGVGGTFWCRDAVHGVSSLALRVVTGDPCTNHALVKDAFRVAWSYLMGSTAAWRCFVKASTVDNTWIWKRGRWCSCVADWCSHRPGTSPLPAGFGCSIGPRCTCTDTSRASAPVECAHPNGMDYWCGGSQHAGRRWMVVWVGAATLSCLLIRPSLSSYSYQLLGIDM
jgi:hypothetical protein